MSDKQEPTDGVRRYKPLNLHLPKHPATPDVSNVAEVQQIISPEGGLKYTGRELFETLEQFAKLPNPPTVWLCGERAYSHLQYEMKRTLYGQNAADHRADLMQVKYKGMVVRILLNTQARHRDEVRMISDVAFDRAMALQREQIEEIGTAVDVNIGEKPRVIRL